MSNIIKWNYINFDQEEKMVIDSDHTKERGNTRHIGSSDGSDDRVLGGDTSYEGILKALNIKTAQDIADEFSRGDLDGAGFSEGMPGIRYDKMKEEERERIALEVDSLISNAREEAERLIQEANEQVDAIKNLAFEEGKQEGYQAGLNEGQASIEAMKAELRNQETELSKAQAGLEERFAQQIKEADAFFADMIGTLVEKITGIVTKDRKDIIIYLLEKAMTEAGQSERFVLRVSPEDMETVEGQKEALMASVREGSQIEIIQDESLSQNQCLIEADSKIINSSLDAQLRILKENLRLLS